MRAEARTQRASGVRGGQSTKKDDSRSNVMRAYPHSTADNIFAIGNPHFGNSTSSSRTDCDEQTRPYWERAIPLSIWQRRKWIVYFSSPPLQLGGRGFESRLTRGPLMVVIARSRTSSPPQGCHCRRVS